jgi:hypothetical protein
VAKNLIFEIPEASPHEIPMTRLLEYLTEIATILGNRKNVHFLRVEDGSLPCYMEVDEAVEKEVIERVNSVLKGDGTEEAQAAFKTLRRYLREDEYSAALKSEDNIIAAFPRSPEEKILGPFIQEGSLDGLLVNIGGTDATIPVHLLSDGIDFRCNTTVEMARRLRNYLLEKPIRVFGKGKWYRNPNGHWHLDIFDISSFEELDDSSIPEIVLKLRAIPGNPLMSSNDPLEDVRRVRYGE